MDPRQRARLGRTDVEVTRLGLGLAPIGGLYRPVAATQAYATVERAWELGIRYFDTAPLYGVGRSERRAGQVLASKPRSEYTLSTKVGRLVVPGASQPAGATGCDAPADDATWAEPTGDEIRWDLTASGARRSYAESLDRLGLDRVDILHIHDPDDHLAAALTGALPALVELRAAGRIGAVSVGMNQAAALAAFVRTGDVDCVLLAGRYTLLDQSGLTELLPLCADRGVSVIAGGVYNSGLLAEPVPGARYDYRPASAAELDRALAARAVCESHGVPLRAAAVQFPLSHPAVAAVVVGARTTDEITDAATMFTVDIPDACWRDLRAAGILADGVPLP